jgi:hypothetical protein
MYCDVPEEGPRARFPEAAQFGVRFFVWWCKMADFKVSPVQGERQHRFTPSIEQRSLQGLQ